MNSLAILGAVGVEVVHVGLMMSFGLGGHGVGDLLHRRQRTGEARREPALDSGFQGLPDDIRQLFVVGAMCSFVCATCLATVLEDD